MKLRVLLDGRKLGDGGIGTYIENLVRGLCLLSRKGEIDCRLTLLVTPEYAKSRRASATADASRPQSGEGTTSASVEANGAQAPLSADLLTGDILRDGELLIVEEPSAKYSLSEYLFLARRHRKLLQSHDVYHSPHYTLPFFLGCPSVVTIHDVIHVTHPETPLHRPAGRALITSALRRASHVITVSEASKREIRKLLGAEAGASSGNGASRGSPPVSVIPNALKETFRVRPPVPETVSDSAKQKLPYCLFVGNAKPHKGWRTLLTAWQLLLSDPKAETPHLVLVGQLVGEEVESAIKQCGLQGLVSVVRKVADEDLRALYEGARAVVVPSLAEGFALPALEALACGAPLVTTPLPAVREVCGDVPWYADGFTARSIADAVSRCLREAPLAQERRAAGQRRAAQFDIEQTAWLTWQVYSSARDTAQKDAPQNVAGVSRPAEEIPGSAAGIEDDAELEIERAAFDAQEELPLKQRQQER